MRSHRAPSAPPSEPAFLATTRVGVYCSACGGPAVAIIALVRDGRRLLAEELDARCPRCGDVA